MNNIDIDSICNIFLFIKDVKSYCNFQITNKMIYVASKYYRGNNHKNFLKHFFDIGLYKELTRGTYTNFFENKNFLDNCVINDNISSKYIKTFELKPLKFNLRGFNNRDNIIVYELPIGQFVFKNLRFIRSCDNFHSSLLNRCHLIIGGSPIDNIDFNFFDVLHHLYNIDDISIIPFYFCQKNKFLPSLKYHEIQIVFVMSSDFNKYNIDSFILEIDAHEIELFNNETFNIDFIITQHNTQCDVVKLCNIPDINSARRFIDYSKTDIILCDSGVDFYKLSDYRFCTHLILHFSDCIDVDVDQFEDIVLVLLGVKIVCLSLSFIINIGYMYNESWCKNKLIIPLTKSLKCEHISQYTVNLSRQNDCYLCIKSNLKYKLINIFAINANILRICGGMGTTQFCRQL